MSPWGALAAVLVLLLLVAGALLGLGWKASGHAMHPGAPAYPWAVGDFPNLDGTEVTVKSRTGVEPGLLDEPAPKRLRGGHGLGRTTVCRQRLHVQQRGALPQR